MFKKITFLRVFLGLTLLSSKEKKSLTFLSIIILLSSALETLAFGSVVPFLGFLLEPDKVEGNKYYQSLFSYLDSPSRETMTYYLCGFSLCLLFFSNILSIIVNHVFTLFSASCWRRISDDLMSQCIERPYEWFLSNNSAIVTRLFHHDLLLWSRDSINLLLTLLSDVIIFVFLTIMVVSLFPGEGLWAITLSFFLGLSLVFFCRPKLKKYASLSRKSSDKTMLSTNQIFIGIKDIKISSNTNFFRDFFNNSVHEASHAFIWLRFWTKFYPLVFILIVQTGLVLVAMFLWLSGLSSSEIAVFLALAIMISSRVIPSVNRIMSSIGALINIHPYILGIINFKKDLENSKQMIFKLDNPDISFKDWNTISFKKINFKYKNSNKKILNDFNIELKRGKIYGIVGESGSGKTTIIDLLLGLLFGTNGKIKIDSKNLNSSNVKSWIKEVGYVPQSPYLIDATLKENIAFSLDDELINDEKIKECIEKSQLTKLVNDLEFGENTSIGERGLKISGGQKQRIAVARALYKDPSLLILDEATNALDSINEKKILNVVKSLKPTITTILISHNFSNLKEADGIIMLKEGNIKHYGNFDYLMKNSLEFKQLTSLKLK